MFELRGVEGAPKARFVRTIGSWLKVRNPRWAHTSLRHGSRMLTTAFTWAAAGLSITPD